MDMDFKKQLSVIADHEELTGCEGLDYNAVVCLSRTNQKVVLKTGDRISEEGIRKTEYMLRRLNKENFSNVLVPSFISRSHEGDLPKYIITTYIEAEQPAWSEHNGDPNLGGKNIELNYLAYVIKVIEDLELVDAKGIEVKDSKENVKQARELVEVLKRDELITTDTYQSITEILDIGVQKYYDNKNLVLSNGDFYPKNVLKGDNNKAVVIDWDGAVITPKEHMSMYFWCNMFGNEEFQNRLMSYYRGREDYDEERYLFGLILAALEDIQIWVKHEQCSEVLEKYLSYLECHRDIIKVN